MNKNLKVVLSAVALALKKRIVRTVIQASLVSGSAFGLAGLMSSNSARNGCHTAIPSHFGALRLDVPFVRWSDKNTSKRNPSFAVTVAA